MSKKSYSFVEEPSLRRSKADRRARELLTSTVRAHTGRHTHAEWRRRAEEYYKQAGLLSEDSEFSARQPITYGPQGLIEGITDSNLERIILEQLSDDGAFDTVVPIDLARKKERGVGKTRFSSSQKYRGKQAGQSESKASWATVKVAFNPLSYMAATYQGRDLVRVGTAFDYYRHEYGPRYMWRPYSDEAESRSARCKFMQFSHQEPAFLEALLSLVRAYRDQGILSGSTLSSAALIHRGKAMKMLQQRLNRPETAYEDVSIWTIALLLVADQGFGDWISFNVNYRGLLSIIEARGGPDAIKAYDPRMFLVLEHLKQIHEHYEQGLQDKDPKGDPLPPIRLSTSPAPVLESSKFTDLPKGFVSLIKDSQIRHEMVPNVRQVLRWLRAHAEKDQIEPNTGTRELHKPPAIDDLFAALEWPNLTHAEFFTIIALQGLMALHVPYFVNSSIVHYVPKYVKYLEASLAQAEYRCDYMLWTCYAICGLPITIMFLPAPNWKALDLTVRRDFFGRSWEDTRSVFADFHLDSVLEMRAEHIWGLLPGLLRT